jgi:hypothetical protein
VFKEEKVELIAAMDRELEKIPGVLWNFSQPIADNMEEAVSGVKGELAIKIYGDDLVKLEQKGDQIVNVMRNIKGVEDLGLFRVIGQPNLNFTVDRDQAARYGLNVSDVQDAIQTAVGGNAVSQVLQGEQRYDLVPRYMHGSLSRHQGSHREHSFAGAHRRARLAGAALQSRGEGRRLGDLSRSEFPLCGDQVQRARPRPRQHRARGHPGRGTGR